VSLTCVGEFPLKYCHDRGPRIKLSAAERVAAEHLLSFFPDIELTLDEYIRERREGQDALWPTVAPLPGALKLVQHLHKHSIPIAIATGSQKRNLDLKTAHLPHLLDPFGGHILCADDIERGKPCPDVFLAAAERLGRHVGKGDHTEVDDVARLERSKGLVFEDAVLCLFLKMSHEQ
jgi:pseudouridine-5'-monophosphatase